MRNEKGLTTLEVIGAAVVIAILVVILLKLADGKGF